jgi:hypothetical protein
MPMLPRCRPAVEALESRLAPSVTPMLENPVAAVMQAPLPPAIHATIQSPAPDAAVIASVAPAPDDVAPPAPLQASDRAEFFASTFAEHDTPQLTAMEFSSEDAAIVLPVVAPVPSPAHAGQPLLVWVLGMTCMLMLSWERHLRKPSLVSSTARRIRRMKSLSDLSTLFTQVWRPRARSACS